MKENPNEFVAGDNVMLDTGVEVTIHEVVESQRLAVIGRPGEPRELWSIVQIRRLQPKRTFKNN